MPLNSTILAQALLTEFKKINAESDDTQEKICEAIAVKVIEHIIANGVIVVSPGISVQVVPATGTGKTIKAGTGTIS